MTAVSTLRTVQLLALAAASAAAPAALAQSSCSSDRQAQPVALLERFINADCSSCWTDAKTPAAKVGQLALDWVLPGSKGDDAPLSAVASRDGQRRLQALGITAPAEAFSQRAPVQQTPASRLRVAKGPVMSAYSGASIAFRPSAAVKPDAAWTASLVLIEQLPRGTEGTPVPRNLVRNIVQVRWTTDQLPIGTKAAEFLESRVMNVPPGAKAERLSVAGWVEDEQGRIVIAAQARCVTGK
ncbi:MAG: hypothetical protein V4614_18570 [Pseudomonadota bacterium]